MQGEPSVLDQFRKAISVGWKLVLITTVSVPLPAQSENDPSLPAGAVVIERASVPTTTHPDRALLLWMVSPRKYDRGPLSESNPYTCPEWTLGSYYTGPTRISLVDTREKKIINTINLRHAFGGEDEFDIPYRIVAGSYYIVPGQPRGSEGKPALLALRDINGDGLALETAFFEAEACMGLLTTAIGYSPRQDKLVQYQVDLNCQAQKVVAGQGIVNTGEPVKSSATWVDYLFSEEPIHPGEWSFKIDYTGRGGALETYTVRYDQLQEKFVGSLNQLLPQEDPK